MEKWKPLRASHFSTPPTATRLLTSSLRYTNNPTGAKDRADHGLSRGLARLEFACNSKSDDGHKEVQRVVAIAITCSITRLLTATGTARTAGSRWTGPTKTCTPSIALVTSAVRKIRLQVTTAIMLLHRWYSASASCVYVLAYQSSAVPNPAFCQPELKRPFWNPNPPSGVPKLPTSKLQGQFHALTPRPQGRVPNVLFLIPTDSGVTTGVAAPTISWV
jgi:hypothetical protein